MAELMLNTPIFPGSNDFDQMLQIIRILGSPSQEEIEAMNSTQGNFKFPIVAPISFSKVNSLLTTFRFSQHSTPTIH